MDWHYLFISLDGRINRQPYWIGAILVAIAGLLIQYLALMTLGPLAALVIGLICLYPSFALMLKRAHDRNRPTWLIAIFFGLMAAATLLRPDDVDNMTETPTLFVLIAIPWILLSLFFLVDLGFLRGTRGPNRYGPDPLA